MAPHRTVSSAGSTRGSDSVLWAASITAGGSSTPGSAGASAGDPGGAGTERRGFIRHPVSIPIEIQLEPRGELRDRESDDVGQGGLRFRADRPLAAGSSVHVRIAVVEPAFEADGRVAWCEPGGDGYDVGVAFVESRDRFTARMIEQVCYIEQFRREQAAGGRALSAREAAHEWVRRFAAGFPEV